MSTNALKVALRYDPSLAETIATMRTNGHSIDSITHEMCVVTGLVIGRESVRAYLKDVEK